MDVNKEYSYLAINDFSVENDYLLYEYGQYVVGEHFLALKHKDIDVTISFVLVGASHTDSMYKCIYSDLNTEKDA